MYQLDTKRSQFDRSTQEQGPTQVHNEDKRTYNVHNSEMSSNVLRI